MTCEGGGGGQDNGKKFGMGGGGGVLRVMIDIEGRLS
jgi:hypothetical protein